MIDPKEFVSEFYKESDVENTIRMLDALVACSGIIFASSIDDDDNIMLGGVTLTEDEILTTKAESLKEVTKLPMSMTMNVVFVGCVIDAKSGKRDGLGIIFEIPTIDVASSYTELKYGFEIWTVKNHDKFDERCHPYAHYNRKFSEFVHCETGFNEYTRATVECRMFANALYDTPASESA